MRSETRSYRTGGQDTVLDITDDCAEFVRGQGDGLLHVFVPHATAGIAIIETGSGSDDDLLAVLMANPAPVQAANRVRTAMAAVRRAKDKVRDKARVRDKF